MKHCVFCGTDDGPVTRKCRCNVENIVEKKKELVKEITARQNEEFRQLGEQSKKEMKCFWTYPWGHVRSKYFTDQSICQVCNKHFEGGFFLGLF